MPDSMQDKVAGKAKEVTGKVTGDQATETEGKAQQTRGNVKGKADEVADNVRFAAENADREARRPNP